MATTEECDSYQRALFITNVVGGLQIAFGALSFFGCLSAMVVIIGYRKDARNLRDRLLLAVFISNAIYSISDCIPDNLQRDSGSNCGNQLIITGIYEVNSGFYAFWGFGMYTSVCYELFMIAVSLTALTTGSTRLGVAKEVVAHVLCVLVGLSAAYLGFTVEKDITGNSTLRSSQDFVEDSQIDVDFNLFFYGVAAAIICLSLVLWVVLRLRLRKLKRQWHKAKTEMEYRLGKNVRDTKNKRVLLQARLLGYDETAKPLEKYVLVFATSLAPLVVGATPFCTLQSIRAWSYWQHVPCEGVVVMVLAMRSLAMAVAYFWDREPRQQLFRFSKLLSLLKSRFMCESHVRFAKNEKLTQVHVLEDEEENEEDDHTSEEGSSKQRYHLLDG